MRRGRIDLCALLVDEEDGNGVNRPFGDGAQTGDAHDFSASNYPKDSRAPESIGLAQAERYIGLEYVDGVFDCADLVVLVQRELFGRDLAAPTAADRSRGVRGQARDLRAALDKYVRPTAVPTTGCAVLLWETTSHGIPPLNRQWHIGTVFMHLGAPWVLHCANPTEGTRLQPLDAITSCAMHFESFLEWL